MIIIIIIIFEWPISCPRAGPDFAKIVYHMRELWKPLCQFMSLCENRNVNQSPSVYLGIATEYSQADIPKGFLGYFCFGLKKKKKQAKKENLKGKKKKKDVGSGVRVYIPLKV